MLILGIVLLVIGALVAAFVHRIIGLVIAAVGGILVLVALLALADTAEARSSWSLLLAGPYLARAFRWAANKLDPPDEVLHRKIHMAIFGEAGGFSSLGNSPALPGTTTTTTFRQTG